jgi:hypothetical protein
MQTVPLSGTVQTVSFYPDDTIETVSRWIALAMDSHPARLFLEAYTTLPSDHYSSNPNAWSELFFRLSYDGETVNEDALRTYLAGRSPLAQVAVRGISKKEWDLHQDDLMNLFTSDEPIREWRSFGVPVDKSIVLPLPPKSLEIPASRFPIISEKSLFETIHPYPVTEFRATIVPADISDTVKLLYYPILVADTPSNLDSVRGLLEKSRKDLQTLLALPAPPHETMRIVRAKWYVPLIETQFTSVRARFEQMFYGVTVSKKTPFVGYFTSKTEKMRSKFYVEDPNNKVSWLDEDLVRNWFQRTMPQRRRPTLLFYRGKDRNSFDRIAITETDVILQSERPKSSKQTLDELREDLLAWLGSMDAVVPFLLPSDMAVSRWELSDMALVASYSSEVHEFDMRKMSCLQTIFGHQDKQFRLLRAEVDVASPDMLQAYQILQQDETATADTLVSVLGISEERAEEILLELRSEDMVSLERYLRAYPTIQFTEREVFVRFVTNPERTLRYADILRYVLTNDVSEFCVVAPDVAPQVVAVPAQAEEDDNDLGLLEGFLDEEEEKEPAVGAPLAAASASAAPLKQKVVAKPKRTYNYFNRRLEAFDPETFDQSFYNRECDKPRQAVVLTAKDRERIKSKAGEAYTYQGAPKEETLELKDPDGTVICPPYWCMRDEIPLREEQLVDKDGELACPVCKGKVRPDDSVDPTEYTVIRRDTAAKYPDYLKRVSTKNKRKVPCCYLSPQTESKVVSVKEDDTYILRETVAPIPSMRWAYLSDEMASKLHMKTKYSETVDKNRLVFGKSDIFRIGLGRPSRTLPTLFGVSMKIPSPKDARANLLRCSFFRTRSVTSEGDTTLDRLINKVDTDFKEQRLTFLEELEYTTSFLKCEVILIDGKSSEVLCGFWKEMVGADRFTIAVIDTDILGIVQRLRVGQRTYKTNYKVDLRDAMFGEKTWPYLTKLHDEACATNLPTIDDAINEIRLAGKREYQVVLDPFDRIQAVFLPTEVLLPVVPTTIRALPGVAIRSGFADIRTEELPIRDTARAILEKTVHSGFKIKREHRDADGKLVEFELASGFRVPFQAVEDGNEGPATEVLETVRAIKEETLVSGPPNDKDAKIASRISYESELFEFLLYSLSQNIELDAEGNIIDRQYADLRRSIQDQSQSLYKDLQAWMKKNSYKDTTQSPINFINKVRTPCGQFKEKDTCNKSSLCGWQKDDCKIRVKSTVDSDALLKQIAKTLRDNGKKRALVLDARLSPFFSTVLYLEMPNELFTTSV